MKVQGDQRKFTSAVAAGEGGWRMQCGGCKLTSAVAAG